MRMASIFLLAVAMAGTATWGWHRGGSAASGADEAPKTGALTLSAEERERAAVAAAMRRLPLGPISEWAQRIAVARAEDFPALLTEARAVVGPECETICRLVAARWADLDAPAAWAALKQDDLASAMIGPWLHRDRAAALAALEADFDGLSERSTGTLIRLQPEVLWELCLKTRRIPPHLPGGPWKALLLAHEAEAEALAQEMVERKDAKAVAAGGLEMLALLARGRAERDPRAALVWIDSLPDEEARSRAQLAVFPFLTNMNRDEVGSLLARLVAAQPTSGWPPRDLESASDDFGKALAKTDLRGAIRWFGEAESLKVSSWVVREILEDALRQGRITAEDALGLVREVKAESMTALNLMPALAAAAAPDKLPRIAESFRDLPADDRFVPAWTAFVENWAAKDLPGALAFASEVKTGLRPALLGAVLASSITENDSSAQMAATIAKVPAALRGEAMEGFFDRGWGTPTMLDGAPFAASVEGISDPEKREAVTERLCRCWSQVDPQAASQWAIQQAEPRIQETALQNSLREWIGYDQWGASQWLVAQASGRGRDAGALLLARTLAADEPDSAWKWATTIADPVLREEGMAATMEAWQKVDPSAARGALETAFSLDPRVRRRLREKLQPEEEEGLPAR